MGSKKKASSAKKAEVPVAAGVPNPQASSGKASKEDEIGAIFANKKRKIGSENQPTLAEEDGIGSRPSLQKKKKGKKTPSPAVEQEDKKKVGSKESRGGKAGKSSSAGAEPKKSRKKTADGFTVYGEDELKWNSKDAGTLPVRKSEEEVELNEENSIPENLTPGSGVIHVSEWPSPMVMKMVRVLGADYEIMNSKLACWIAQKWCYGSIVYCLESLRESYACKNAGRTVR